jgi:hypothetical protein
MELNLFLDGLDLLGLIAINLQYFDGDGLCSGSVDGPLDLAKAAFSDCFL